MGLEKILSWSSSRTVPAIVQETVEVLEGLLSEASGLVGAVAAATDRPPMLSHLLGHLLLHGVPLGLIVRLLSNKLLHLI